MPMWMLAAAFLAAGDVELAAARRAGADEDRVVVLGQQLLQAVDTMTALELDAEVEDVVGLFVDHRVRSRNFGIWLRIMPPAFGSESNTVQ